MALMQVNFNSRTLNRPVQIQVILPVENTEPPYKTLYLLHGVDGNDRDWVDGTCICRWAQEKGLAVVMPAGENSFYLDNEKACNYYGRYIGEELVAVTRKMFPLSHRREDTFIAGLSMGGYGALRNGLKYHETFGRIAALSAALLADEMPDWTNETDEFFRKRDYAETIFGDLTKVKSSDKNPEWLAKLLKEEGKEIPMLYVACGTEDELLTHNRKFRDEMQKSGIELVYEEGPGGHEWDFWNRYIRKVLDWVTEGEA